MANIVQVPNTGTRHNIFPKYKVELGPWSRGLDITDDPSLISSSVLSESVNLMIRDDGILRIRPQVTRQYPDSTFFGIDPTLSRIQSMGILRLTSDNICPLVAKFDLQPTQGGDGKITFWRYSEDSSGSIPAVPEWRETYAEMDYPYTTDLSWHIPIQAFVYDIIHFILFNRIGFQVSAGVTDPISTDPLMGPARLYDPGGSPPDESFIRKALILKDRIILHTDKDVYWSTANPTGVPDDWSETAPFTSGNLGFNRELTHDRVHDIIVFDDELYILGSTTVSKLVWTTDPGVDGVFAVVSSAIGGETFETYNGELYLFNGFGLYKLVNSYFIEVSEPVRDFIRGSSKGTPESLMTLDGSIEDYDERPVVGMYRIDNLLLIGPLNLNAALRYDDVADPYSCNVYLIYNMDLNLWFKWQFNPNGSDDYPIAGPSQSAIMTQGINDPAFPDRYLWVGRTLVNGSTVGSNKIYGQGIYSMESAANLIVDTSIPVGYDNAGPDSWGSSTEKYKSIGIILKTAYIDLGDSDFWKRLQTTLIDARDYNPPILDHGVVRMGYILDDPSSTNDSDRIINLNSLSVDRLSFGGAYRCRRFGFYYDSLSGIAASLQNVADLDLIKKISMYITLSRKDTSGKAN